MRPRRPFGPNPPGRLAATMVKVLAAELSDSGRLARGKRYWAESAVVDIVVGHGAVTAEVQGGRPQPYVVTIEATAGSGVPSKRDVSVRCTCPDDAGTGAEACKHAVAALFALADEIAIEPELVDRWRRGTAPRRGHQPAAAPGDAADTIANTIADTIAGTVADTIAGTVADVVELRPRHDEPVIGSRLDDLAVALRAPSDAAAPDLPRPDELAHPPLASRRLAAVLADALAHLTVNWD